MAITRDQLEGELKKLGKTELEIKDLLDPEPKPIKDFPNIRTGFHPLDEWLDNQPFPQQKPCASRRNDSHWRRWTIATSCSDSRVPSPGVGPAGRSWRRSPWSVRGP